MYTDIAIKVPLGHYGRIAPKSGITLKHHVTVLAGVIDPDYTGNVGVVLHNLSSDTKFTRQVGQPIGQLILEVASICNVVCFWPSAMKKSQMQYLNIKIVYSFGIYSRIGN